MPFPQKTERTTNPATGQSYPLGMWIGGWASSFINSEVARIILQEKIGFNVRDMGIGYATVDGFYALTGCANPETIGDRGCDGVSVTYTHVNVEAWTGGYQPEWDALQIAYPDMAPINLGNMGYNGKTSFFFPSKVRDEAWETEGLNLDFFRGYNISWHDATKYFDSPKAFDGATLRPCNETRLMITSAMKFYAELTGDWDGVEIVGEEVYGKCFDDHFWYPPACRSNASACFVWLTAGNGWDMEGTMQKTTSYHIPMVAATEKNWTLFTQLPKIKTSWFYWWVPDPTFLTLSPMEQAWDIGDKRTQATTTSVDIAVSRDLHILAPNVQNFLENWEIPMAEVRMHTKWLAAGCRTISRRKSGPSGSRTPPNASPSSAFGTPTLRSLWQTGKTKVFWNAGLASPGASPKKSRTTTGTPTFALSALLAHLSPREPLCNASPACLVNSRTRAAKPLASAASSGSTKIRKGKRGVSPAWLAPLLWEMADPAWKTVAASQAASTSEKVETNPFATHAQKG